MWWKQLKEKDVTVPLISASAGDCVEMGYYGMKMTCPRFMYHQELESPMV